MMGKHSRGGAAAATQGRHGQHPAQDTGEQQFYLCFATEFNSMIKENNMNKAEVFILDKLENILETGKQLSQDKGEPTIFKHLLPLPNTN